MKMNELFTANKGDFFFFFFIGVKGACALKRVTSTGRIIPVDGRRYRSVDAAKAAAAYGITVEKIGDLYQII